MESKNKFLVKKSSPPNYPHKVLSVLNLTTDFLPPQKQKLSKFPVLSPRKHRSMENGISSHPKFWVPHYREHVKLAVKKNHKEKRRSCGDLLTVGNLMQNE